MLFRSLYRFQNGEIAHQRKISEGMSGVITDDGHGMLWIASASNRFVKLAKRDFESAPEVVYSEESGFVDTRRAFPFFDRENNLWIATWSRGFMILPDRNIFQVSTGRLMVNQMAVADSNGHIWVASEAGVWEVFPEERGSWSKYLHHFSGSAPDQSVYFLYVDPDGHLWVNANARAGAMQCFSIDRRAGRESVVTLIRMVIPDSGGKNPHLHKMFVDRQRRLWCSVNGVGVIVRDLETLRKLRTYTSEDGLPDNSVLQIFQDREDNVWLGGFFGGLAVASAREPIGARLRTFTTANGLPDNGIRSFAEDAQGRLWIGKRYGGLVLYRDGRFQTISMREGLQSNAIFSLAEDDRRRLWLGTDVGLECVSETTAAPLRSKNEFIGNRVLSCGVYRACFSGL